MIHDGPNGRYVRALIHTDGKPMEFQHRVDKFFDYCLTFRGIKRVVRNEMGGWTYIYAYGTVNATLNVETVLNISGMASDPNADHDHAACIERARALGVPPSWAHTPETYLSM